MSPEQQMLISFLTLIHTLNHLLLPKNSVHTRLELLWGEILSQDVLDCEKLVSQSHITATDSRMNSFWSENEAILGWKPWKNSFVRTCRFKDGFDSQEFPISGVSLEPMDCHFSQCVVALSGMGGCSQWLNLDQDGRNQSQSHSFGMQHSWMHKACCLYTLKMNVNSMIQSGWHKMW